MQFAVFSSHYGDLMAWIWFQLACCFMQTMRKNINHDWNCQNGAKWYDGWLVTVDHTIQLNRSEMNVDMWVYFERTNSAELGKLMGLDPVSLVTRNGWLRWLGRMECSDDIDWFERCPVMNEEWFSKGCPSKEDIVEWCWRGCEKFWSALRCCTFLEHSAKNQRANKMGHV